MCLRGLLYLFCHGFYCFALSLSSSLFLHVIVMFAGCAEIFYLDVPGVNGDVDRISDGRSTYVRHVAEINKIMQADGVTCFPCSSPDGFLGSLFTRFRKDDTAYGRVHLQAHPVVSTALAQFFQDAVLYATTQCMIETLTLGPRECRPPLRTMVDLNVTPWMNYWRFSPLNRIGLTESDIQDEIQRQISSQLMDAEEGIHK